MKNRIVALGVLCMFFSVAVPGAFAAFSFQAETTAEDTAFGFRVYGASDFQVSWDGGTTWEAPVGGEDLLFSNDYGDAGVRNISVTGTAARITFFGNDCTPALLTDITSRLTDGVEGIVSAQDMFRDCTGITAFTQSDWFDEASGNVTNMCGMFRDAVGFDQDLGNWDVSNVVLFGFHTHSSSRGMFESAKAFDNGGSDSINDWDVSASVNMSYMFRDAANFNRNIADWDTSSVDRMMAMFNDANAFDQPIGNWDVSKVTTFSMMFRDNKVFNQYVGDWDTSSATEISGMFQGTQFFNQDLSTKVVNEGTEDEYIAWDISNVTILGGHTSARNGMFNAAAAFNNGDAPGESNNPLIWDTSSVIEIRALFLSATSFNQDVSMREVTVGDRTFTAWDVGNVQHFGGNYSRGMFRGATAFNQDVSNWDVSSAENMNNMFENTSSFDQDLSAWDVSNVTTFTNFLAGSGISSENYDNLLVGWSQLTLQDNAPFDGGPCAYSLEGAGGRVTIIKNHDWIFRSDGGLVAQAEYEVTNPMELQGCAMHPDKTYVVMNDIDLSGTETWSAGAGFWPIGDDGTPFTGVFDGGGHALSGLHINRPGLDYVGLFGEIAGTVSNIGVSGSVSGGDHVGGFAGILSSGAEIEDCYARVDVTAASDAAHRGGFVGRNEQGAIRRVYSTGSVLPPGGSNGGGLAGSADAGGGYEDADNFWDTQTSGWETSAMGTGRTTREMQDIGTFEDVWNIELSRDEINDRYPYLTGLTEPVWYIYVIPRGTIFNMR